MSPAKVWPVFAAGVVFAGSSIGIQWFAYRIGSGPVGMVIAYMLGNFITTLFEVLLLLAIPSIRELKLFHWSRAAFINLWEIIVLILKSLLYQFATNFQRQIGTIVIGLLGESAMAAQAILLRFALISSYIALGFWNIAVAAMGRATGSKKSDKFFSTFTATLTLFALFASFILVLFFAFRYPLAFVTTSLESVQTIVITLMPLMAIYAALFIMWMGSHSIAYSVGSINAPTFVIVFSSFCIGIPISMLLMFLTSLGLYGFYIGLIATYAVALAILWTYYAYNWSDLIRPDFQSNAATELSPLVSSKSSPFETERTQSLVDGGDSNSPHAIVKFHSSEAASRSESMSDFTVVHTSLDVGPSESSRSHQK